MLRHDLALIHMVLDAVDLLVCLVALAGQNDDVDLVLLQMSGEGSLKFLLREFLFGNGNAGDAVVGCPGQRVGVSLLAQTRTIWP